MVINDAVIVNIYLAFRSHYCFGLRGMKAFLLNFLVRPGGVGGWGGGERGVEVLLVDSFHRFSN